MELLRLSYIFAIQVSPVMVITKNTNAIPIFLFVCYFIVTALMRYRYRCRWSASHTLRFKNRVSAMRNDPGKYAPRPPHCPACAQVMRLARLTSRFGDLPDLYTFECRACGVTHIEAATVALPVAS